MDTWTPYPPCALARVSHIRWRDDFDTVGGRRLGERETSTVRVLGTVALPGCDPIPGDPMMIVEDVDAPAHVRGRVLVARSLLRREP